MRFMSRRGHEIDNWIAKLLQRVRLGGDGGCEESGSAIGPRFPVSHRQSARDQIADEG